MITGRPLLDRHLQALAVAYPLRVAENGEWLMVSGFRLPPGHNSASTDMLAEIPADYPISPPGVGSRLYLPRWLRFRGRKLRDLHENVTPGCPNWAWFCYQWIQWDPCRDDLIAFLEMVRADLTDPPTE